MGKGGKKMGKIYTVTLNPSLDYTMLTPHLLLGEVNRAGEAVITPGGKGINVSIILKNLGMESTILGLCGGFVGAQIEELLTGMGHTVAFTPLSDGCSRINVKLCGSGTTDINALGPMTKQKDLDAFLGTLDRTVADGDTVVFAGAAPRPDSSEVMSSQRRYVYSEALRLLSDRNVTSVVDTTGAELLEAVREHPFLIKPNRRELAALFPDCDPSDLEGCARRMQTLGARNVLVSCDRDGAVLVTAGGGCIHHPAPQGRVINTVGAGDSMVAGFLYGFSLNHNYNEALDYGIAAGSATTFSKGLASRDEIVNVLNRM